MHDASLQRGHRCQLYRGAGPHGFLGRVVGFSTQRLRAPRAVAVGIDEQAQPAFATLQHDPLRKMLHSVDRLAVAADEEA